MYKPTLLIASVFLSFSMVAQNDFAFNLYEQLGRTSKQNVLFSPTSIMTAFSMAYEGANGATQTEFEKLFGFKEDNSDFLNQIKELDSVASICNSVWIQEKFKILPEYLTKMENRFGAKPRYTDFHLQPKESADSINQWIDESTKGMIKDMLSPGDVGSLQMALVNAIYFKQNWKHPFDKALTRDDIFNSLSGSKDSIEMMHSEDHYRAFAGQNEKIIELPYEDGKTSMVILLPNKMKGYKLTQEVYNSLLQSMRSQRVVLELPKFTFETSTMDLIPPLQELGMNIAFSNGADFSVMRKERDLKIGKVLHKAKIIVNEEGTEAAAATVIGMVFTTSISMPPPPPLKIRVDQPFYYFIKDNKTGAILFMGTMNEM